MEMKKKDLRLYNSPVYRRSRNAYCLECAFAYFVTLITGGSFLASFLSYVGLSDALVGMLSSVLSLSGIFQLLTVFVVPKVRNIKRYVITVQIGSNLLLVGMFLVPFIPAFANCRGVVVTLCILLAYVGRALVSSMLFRWGNSFVHPMQRGIYTGGKEMISLISGIVVSMIAGFGFDALAESGNMNGAFCMLAIAGMAFVLSDLICMLFTANQTVPIQQQSGGTVMPVLWQILKTKPFLKILIVAVCIGCANTLMAFQSTYRLKELGYSAGMVQLVTNGGLLLRAMLSRPIGKLADKVSYVTTIRICLGLVAASFLMEMFTVPDSRWLMIPAIALYHGAQAGISGNLENIAYTVVDEQHYVQATSLKNCITGVGCFAVSLMGGGVLDWIQNNGNQVFGISLYGQQVLMGCATLMVLGTALYIYLYIERPRKREAQGGEIRT